MLGASGFTIPAGTAKVVRLKLTRRGAKVARAMSARSLRARLAGDGLHPRVVRLAG